MNRICGNCKYSDNEPFCQFQGEITYNHTCDKWEEQSILDKYNIEYVEHPEEYTCYKCQSLYKCPFAYDDYNRNGDCLMEH